MANEENVITPPSGRRRRVVRQQTPGSSSDPFRLDTTPIIYNNQISSPQPFSYTNLLQFGHTYYPQQLPQHFHPQHIHPQNIHPQQIPQLFHPQQIPSPEPQQPPESQPQPETQPPPDEVEEIIPETQPNKTRNYTSRRKKTPWTNEEEIALAKTWVDTSEDNRVGNSQRRDSFWARVLTSFSQRMGQQNYRTADQMNSKWKDMAGKVSKFCAIYNNVSARWRSGSSDADIQRVALTRYKDEVGVQFTHLGAWEFLKDVPKFNSTYCQLSVQHMAPSAPSSKRSKTSTASYSPGGSDAHFFGDVNEFGVDDELEDDEEEEQEEFQVPPEPSRPPGRARGKQSASTSSKSSNRDENIGEIMNLLEDLKTQDDKKLELKQKKLEEEQKRRELKQKKLERQEEKDYHRDVEIYLQPIDHLPPELKAVAMEQKEMIKNKRGWA